MATLENIYGLSCIINQVGQGTLFLNLLWMQWLVKSLSLPICFTEIVLVGKYRVKFLWPFEASIVLDSSYKTGIRL